MLVVSCVEAAAFLLVEPATPNKEQNLPLESNFGTIKRDRSSTHRHTDTHKRRGIAAGDQR